MTTKIPIYIALIAVICVDVQARPYYSSNPLVNVKRFGATGDGVTDDTTALRNAITATTSGTTLCIPHGIYRITDTLEFENKTGIEIVGQGTSAWGASEAVILWDGGNAKPIIKGDYLKYAIFRNLVFKSSDTTSNRATHAFMLAKEDYSSNGPLSFFNCRFMACDIGLSFGDDTYNNDMNASEVICRDCVFDCRIGVYVSGIPGASQHVNNTLENCIFVNTSTIAEIGVYLVGGQLHLLGCSFGSAGVGTYPYTCVYLVGDAEFTHPMSIDRCWTEESCYFLRTEWTDTVTQWTRTANITISNTWMNCSRDLTLTTGSIASGSTALTVASADELFLGQRVTLDGASGRYRIVGISGTDITLDENAEATISDANVYNYNEAISVYKNISLVLDTVVALDTVEYAPPQQGAPYADSGFNTLCVLGRNPGLRENLELNRTGSVTGLGQRLLSDDIATTGYYDFLTVASHQQTYSSGAPVATTLRDGVWSAGDVVWNTSPSDGIVGWINTSNGTCGSASAITTGAISSGSKVLTVASGTNLAKGYFIDIAGVSGTKSITWIDDVTVELDSPSDATVSGADITRGAVSFRPFKFDNIEDVNSVSVDHNYAQNVGTTVINTSGAAMDPNLADGTYVGQTCTFTVKVAGNNFNLNILHHATSDPEVLLLDAAEDNVTLIWDGTDWIVKSGSGYTYP